MMMPTVCVRLRLRLRATAFGPVAELLDALQHARARGLADVGVVIEDLGNRRDGHAEVRRDPLHRGRGQVSFTRSAMRIGRFSSMLLRAAMPVRHDMAPAREFGSRMCAGRVGLAEDQIAQPRVAAAVAAFGRSRGRDLLALAEVLDQIDLGLVPGLPRLALVVAHLEAALRAVERHAVALDRHERVHRIAHVDAVRVADDRVHRVEDVDVFLEHAAVAACSRRPTRSST